MNTNKYLVESPSTKTILTYKNGQLVGIESIPFIKENHLIGFVKKGILDETKIKILEEFGGKVTKLEVKFEDFWNKYPRKVGKEDAKKRWQKMKETERQEAYNYLWKYIRQVEVERVAFLHPTTYLNSYRWLDEK